MSETERGERTDTERLDAETLLDGALTALRWIAFAPAEVQAHHLQQRACREIERIVGESLARTMAAAGRDVDPMGEEYPDTLGGVSRRMEDVGRRQSDSLWRDIHAVLDDLRDANEAIAAMDARRWKREQIVAAIHDNLREQGVDHMGRWRASLSVSLLVDAIDAAMDATPEPEEAG